MLQRAASNAYSWWWASHIRTKQSKWLEQNLQDMEEKVQAVLKLIEEDGDSFAKRAEMYYKKRPELINFVEESYRAYRSLAERYDHISTELQNANTTIASVFPEQVQFVMDDYDDDHDSPPQAKSARKYPAGAEPPSVPKVPKPPSKNLKTLLMPANKNMQSDFKGQQKVKGGNVMSLIPVSGLNKDEAVEVIDKLQKEILALQTEKEYLKSAYEAGLNRFWEIEQQIKEKQEKIYSLQDEFNVGSLIEDDEARKLMASVALQTCQDTLARLEESHQRSVADAKFEHQRIKDAQDKLVSLKSLLTPNRPDQTPVPDNVVGTMDAGQKLDISSQSEKLEAAQEKQQIEALREKIKEQVDVKFSESLTATDMAEKIDQLVQKVLSFETAVSSQNALIDRLREETEELLIRIQSLEDEKTTLLSDTGILTTELQEMEGRLSQVRELDQNVEAQNTNLQTHFMEARCNLEHLNENINKFSELPATVSLEETAANLVRLQSGPQSGTKSQLDAPDLPTNVETPPHNKKVERISLLPANGTEVAGQGKATDTESEAEMDAKNDQLIASIDTLADEGMVTQPVLSVDVNEGGTEADKPAQDLDIKILSELLQTTTEPNPENNFAGEQDFPEAVGLHVNVDTQTRNAGDEGEPDWRALYMEGLGDREKIILREYTMTLRNYKELKQKVSDMEMMNKDGMVDLSAQLNKLTNLLSKRNEEIQSLRQKLSLLKDSNCCEDPSKDDNEDDNDDDVIKLALSDLRPTTAIEEKFRMQIDELLEENLNFWLRFSSSFNQVQKFQTEVEDLQSEAAKLENKIKKKHDGSTHRQQLPKSDAKPIYKHLSEIRTEITVWLEQSGVLKEELQRRFASLCSIQDEISAALIEACEEIEEAEFTSYRAAKFQGEILNMKQENNKVADELEAACEHANRIVQEIDRTLARLDEDFKLPPQAAAELRHTGSKARVPLRSFIFGGKQKRQRHSFFSSVQPALALHRRTP